MSICRFYLWKCRRFSNSNYTQKKFYRTVLGIETSCDDTGAAIVDEHGHVLGDVLYSQHQIHLDNGGILPTLARFLHKQQIKNVVDNTLKKSNMKLQDISAIATTVKPGLELSLTVGLNYSKKLVQEFCKPFIPVHHMEAHSLIIRMIECVHFPYLVLLASGGHCQIAVVENVDQFFLLGTCTNNAPGEVLDKIARRLKLKNLPECYTMCGGQAIEHLAKDGNPHSYEFLLPVSKYRDCNFLFHCIKSSVLYKIEEEEKKNGVVADGILPNIEDFCASVLYSVTRYLVQKLQRAMVYCETRNLIPENRRTLVFSGGVACNLYIKSALDKLCHYRNWKLVCPPPKLCSDNGIMIAWNGMERFKAGVGIKEQAEDIIVTPSCPLGTDISKDVINAAISVKMFQFHKYQVNDNIT